MTSSWTMLGSIIVFNVVLGIVHAILGVIFDRLVMRETKSWFILSVIVVIQGIRSSIALITARGGK